MGAGGSALPSLLLPRESRLPARCLASPPYLGLNKLLRSGARCCPCARGTSLSLPCASPCLLPFPHAGKSMCPWGEELLKYWTQAPLALVVQQPLGSLCQAGSSSKARHRVGPSLALPWGPPKPPLGQGGVCAPSVVDPGSSSACGARLLRAGVQPPPSLAACLLSPADKLYNTSAFERQPGLHPVGQPLGAPHQPSWAAASCFSWEGDRDRALGTALVLGCWRWAHGLQYGPKSKAEERWE